MTEDEYLWEWQSMRLESELKDLDGDSFESRFQHFCKIMWGEDFTPTIPMGSRGDLKCDGYRVSTRTVYQCYGPRYGQVDVNAALKKIEDDFRGAKDHWGDGLGEWTFVLNVYRDKVPSELVHLIATLSNELSTSARCWNRSDIIDLVKGMPKQRRLETLGRAPIPADLARVTYENIGRALATIRATIGLDDLRRVELPPDVVDKLDWNRLAANTRHFLLLGQAGAERVRAYLRDQVEPEEAERMGQGFEERYKQCASNGSMPDTIFGQMVRFAGGATGEPDQDSAALAIVAHFFATCQIFERPTLVVKK